MIKFGTGSRNTIIGKDFTNIQILAKTMADNINAKKEAHQEHDTRTPAELLHMLHTHVPEKKYDMGLARISMQTG